MFTNHFLFGGRLSYKKLWAGKHRGGLQEPRVHILGQQQVLSGESLLLRRGDHNWPKPIVQYLGSQQPHNSDQEQRTFVIDEGTMPTALGCFCLDHPSKDQHWLRVVPKHFYYSRELVRRQQCLLQWNDPGNRKLHSVPNVRPGNEIFELLQTLDLPRNSLCGNRRLQACLPLLERLDVSRLT